MHVEMRGVWSHAENIAIDDSVDNNGFCHLLQVQIYLLRKALKLAGFDENE